jgi:hypothetical protein
MTINAATERGEARGASVQIKEQHKKEKELSKLAAQELELIERLQKKQAEQVQHHLTPNFALSRRVIVLPPCFPCAQLGKCRLDVGGDLAARGI